MGAASSVVPDTLTKEQAQNLVGASWDDGAEAWFDSECDGNGFITRAQFQAYYGGLREWGLSRPAGR